MREALVLGQAESIGSFVPCFSGPIPRRSAHEGVFT